MKNQINIKDSNSGYALNFIPDVVIQILLIAFLLNTNKVCAQQSSYHVVKDNFECGNLIVKHSNKNGNAIYELECTGNFSFIFNQHYSQHIKCIYNNDKLLYSESTFVVNGNEKKNSITSYNNGVYELVKYGNPKSKLKQPIGFSVLLLYFREPVNETSVFSESFQSMIPLHSTGHHVYSIKLPNGNESVYYYRNGVCVKVVTKTLLFNLEFIINQIGKTVNEESSLTFKS